MDAYTRKDSDGYFLNCVDPGGDTGLALLHIKPNSFQLLEYATVPWRPQQGQNPVTVLTRWRQLHPGTHHLLYENFHLRNTGKAASTDTTPLLVIGAIEQMIQGQRSLYERVFTQEPVQGKRLATDEKLEMLGLHLGHARAQRHVRDAIRHAVSHLVKRGYLPMCRMAFPRGGTRRH
jgi:hypothetical protein